jgi:hypothetical protein
MITGWNSQEKLVEIGRDRGPGHPLESSNRNLRQSGCNPINGLFKPPMLGFAGLRAAEVARKYYNACRLLRSREKNSDGYRFVDVGSGRG